MGYRDRCDVSAMEQRPLKKPRYNSNYSSNGSISNHNLGFRILAEYNKAKDTLWRSCTERSSPGSRDSRGAGLLHRSSFLGPLRKRYKPGSMVPEENRDSEYSWHSRVEFHQSTPVRSVTREEPEPDAAVALVRLSEIGCGGGAEARIVAGSPSSSSWNVSSPFRGESLQRGSLFVNNTWSSTPRSCNVWNSSSLCEGAAARSGSIFRFQGRQTVSSISQGLLETPCVRYQRPRDISLIWHGLSEISNPQECSELGTLPALCQELTQCRNAAAAKLEQWEADVAAETSEICDANVALVKPEMGEEDAVAGTLELCEAGATASTRELGEAVATPERCEAAKTLSIMVRHDPQQCKSSMPESTEQNIPVYKQRLNAIRNNSDDKIKSIRTNIDLKESLWETLRKTRAQLLNLDINRASPNEVDDAETSSAFTPLTQEEEEEVTEALNGANRNQILVKHEPSNIDLSRGALQCLKPGAWLNDEVINLYLELLKEREVRESDKYLKCHFFNTFFYNKLFRDSQSYNFKAVRRWTTQRKLGYSLLECSKIFVPIHKDIHWCLAVINIREKEIQYLDSLKGTDNTALRILAKYLSDEAKDKLNQDLETSSWKLDCPKDIPEQLNGCDCGMFMIKYADFHSRGDILKFTQDNMEYFRKRTVLELLQKKAR